MKTFIATEENQQKILAILGMMQENLVEDEYAKSKIAANYFVMNQTGKQFGVSFYQYDYNPSPDGVRTRDAIGMVFEPSTDTVRGRNDFDSYAMFNGLRVNGYYDVNGEFVVTFFDWEDGFSTKNDTWILFGTHYFQMNFTDTSQETVLTDKPTAGFCPEGKAIRPDGTIRPFVAIAAYMASVGADGKWASVSGAVPVSCSHDTAINETNKKGAQYCAYTTFDNAHIQNIADVVFATKNDKSMMYGCLNYSPQYQVSLYETGVERVILTNSQADALIVGSCVSIGNKTGDNTDRNNAYMNSLANRKIITKKEALEDGTHTAVYVDNGGVTFDTSELTYISTMPWHTGATDKVLGSCGSPGSNTNGKYPYRLFGVEIRNGQYDLIGNQISKVVEVNGENFYRAYIAYDSRLLAHTITDDYVETGIDSPIIMVGWSYIKENGYDPQNPSVIMPIAVGATSTTGRCSALYVNTADTVGNIRAVFAGCNLGYGASGGLPARNAYYGLGYSAWYRGARLSCAVCGAYGA